MNAKGADLERRLGELERGLRGQRVAIAALALAAIGAGAAAWRQGVGQSPDVLRVRRVVVLDDQGRERIFIGQDPKDTQRRSREVGLTIHDA